MLHIRILNISNITVYMTYNVLGVFWWKVLNEKSVIEVTYNILLSPTECMWMGPWALMWNLATTIKSKKLILSADYILEKLNAPSKKS